MHLPVENAGTPVASAGRLRDGRMHHVHQEIKAVEYLGRFGPAKMKSVADHLMLAVSSTTALIDNLEEKGMVVRKRSTADRRVVLVELTENGAFEFARATEEFLKFGKNILMMFEKEDQDRLLELLGKINLSDPVS